MSSRWLGGKLNNNVRENPAIILGDIMEKQTTDSILVYLRERHTRLEVMQLIWLMGHIESNILGRMTIVMN